MTACDTLIAKLVAVDEFVAAGLANFDRLMSRINAEQIAKAACEMSGDGQDNAEGRAQAFAQTRQKATAQGRAELSRELWDRGSAIYLAADLPVAVGRDLLSASAAVRAGLQEADQGMERRLARLRELLIERGTAEEKAGADDEVAAYRQNIAQERAGLHRRLWAAALARVTAAQDISDA